MTISGTVPANGTADLQIQKGQAGLLRLDLWYPGADRFDVTLVTPGGTFGPYVSPATNAAADSKTQTVPGYGNVAGTGGVDAGAALAARRFYRVVSLP
jgi:hypothetical protein